MNSYSNNLKPRKSFFNLSYHSEFAFNNGHPNIDNYGDFYALGTYNSITSTRFTYENQFLLIEFEPYTKKEKNIFDNNIGVSGTWRFTNNYSNIDKNDQSKIDIKQSQIIIHYNGFGFGYGKTNHWWSPGFHSAINLSSNAPSQETYSIGTFKNIRLGKLSLGSKIILMPYESIEKVPLYFSGLTAWLTYHSKPTITLGFHRSYLSGDFNNLSETTKHEGSWTMIDAARLVIEPIFGQSKKNLSYTIPGTPGFDAWDEVLSGYINFNFPDQNLDIYIELASDDNRGNLRDLFAHWDHTLGYTIGFKRFLQLNKKKIFIGAEYLNTKISNTYNPKFYRGGPNSPNYYTKSTYDYFSYNGRRMGAHSGTSSDDFIIMMGIGNQKNITFISFNRERHGVKSMVYPELKNELNLTYNRKMTKHFTIFFTMEYEHIRNYAFTKDNISESKLLWLGTSYSIN